jgi:hypothetical protein
MATEQLSSAEMAPTDHPSHRWPFAVFVAMLLIVMLLWSLVLPILGILFLAERLAS